MRYLLGLWTIILSLVSGCVSLPPSPTTPLCIFQTKYDDPLDKINFGKSLPLDKLHFKCLTPKKVRYKIYVTSPSAQDMIATPLNDYLEMQAYLNKLAEVFKKEFLNKVGK